jgi:hypothetical protein
MLAIIPAASPWSVEEQPATATATLRTSSLPAICGSWSRSIDGVMLRNNAALVANTARIFNVPTTIVAEKTFLGAYV